MESSVLSQHSLPDNYLPQCTNLKASQAKEECVAQTKHHRSCEQHNSLQSQANFNFEQSKKEERRDGKKEDIQFSSQAVGGDLEDDEVFISESNLHLSTTESSFDSAFPNVLHSPITKQEITEQANSRYMLHFSCLYY